MKQTINFHAFADAFRSQGRKDSFSYEGLQALFACIEDEEAMSGIETELDAVELCGIYTEYTPAEAVEYFGLSVDDLGLADELADHREGWVEDRMGALSDELLDDVEEETRRELYEQESYALGLDALIEDDEDAVKAALLEYFNHKSQAIDIPSSNRFILLDY